MHLPEVKLIHVTPEAEAQVTYLARVSNPKAVKEPNDKLLQYLIKHKHWSPFEMASMCLEINTTRSISSQILRHRSFSFQEFSQRYAQVQEINQIPELRRQDQTNRQNSINDLDPKVVEEATKLTLESYQKAFDTYHQLLDLGVAKECAREVLPLASPTKLYMHGTIRSWIHYCDVRTDPSTQKEHRLIAIACREILYDVFPSLKPPEC